ncbi:serine/threonine protein kinase [Pyxidicoccus parkwayensis]|uniref:non-specific serine/threonine protein kinase n=1 Tax=Pyxidicoccus parkwayensis TaxID=2813578 RepID=A0ABX7PCH2_9BACT|nr:serine/threonine protein kinase [Pyxidicoccus parkwaysis]
MEPRGRGSYGLVFRAVHAEHQGAEAVALKLAQHLGDARFAREAELLSRIRHPAVPRLLGHGQWQPWEGLSYPWLAMEWIEGLPLYGWAQVQRPSSRQVLQLLARLARALDATHSAGGLHRDVKGENILVRRSDAQPFLMDFGSGHFLGAATLTIEAYPPGTLAYRAPEAWLYIPRSGKIPAVPYSPRPTDDLFALGVTAFRLITGKYPPVPNPEEEDAWLWRPEALETWTARACNRRCIPELSALVSRMLAPNARARGSAREVAEALEQAARRAGREADVPLFTGEEPRPAGLFALPQHVTVQRPPRPRRWPWFTAAGLGGALALSAAGLLSVSRSEEPATHQFAEQNESEEARDGGTVAAGDTALIARVAPPRAPSVLSPIAVELPPKPLPGQRRPDGNGRCPGKVQVAINGGCWRKVPVDMKDCDVEEGFEYRGACYIPVPSPSRPATSAPVERDDSP